jgi:hypothetical protein
MTFGNPLNQEKCDVFLAPRALLVIGGESRYLWTHKIPKRKADKVNFISDPEKELKGQSPFMRSKSWTKKRGRKIISRQDIEGGRWSE